MYLQERRVPVFLPRVTHRRIYGRHVRQSEIPLFPGYLFFDPSSIARTEVFASRFVADILVPDDIRRLQLELESLALALSIDCSLRESRVGTLGSQVEVVCGPLKGVRGELVRFKMGHRLILRVSFLGKAVELQIDEAFVSRLQ